ncbi:unnamed protein product [Penicillium salamii]|nr:unnamed protein product [Penicillium salamii]CAG8395133.1 unnamed protein product [Penicillium salamii]
MDFTSSWPPTSKYFFRETYTRVNDKNCHNGMFRYDYEGMEYNCPGSILVDLLFAEHQFRYQVQLMNNWMQRSTEEILSESKTRRQTHPDDMSYAEFQKISRICAEYERSLYLKERALPISNIAVIYHSVRNDPRWYLGEYPVAECVAMGGCCARSCGCCEKRLPHLPRRGMSGHCSLACACCERTKGYSFDVDRLALTDQEYKEALESENPAFLTRIAHSYFHPSDATVKDAGTALGTRFSGEVAHPPPYEKHPSRGALECCSKMWQKLKFLPNVKHDL